MYKIFIIIIIINLCHKKGYYNVWGRAKTQGIFGGEGSVPSGGGGYISSSIFKVEDIAPKSLIASCRPVEGSLQMFQISVMGLTNWYTWFGDLPGAAANSFGQQREINDLAFTNTRFLVWFILMPSCAKYYLAMLRPWHWSIREVEECAGGGETWCSVSLLRSSSFTRVRGECGRAALRGRRYRGGRTLYTGSRAGRTSPTMNRAIFYQLSGGVGAPRRVAVRSNMTL
ncbi:hypothetical protein SFRURICE_020348 [Spodoptera frugiperda]|nr:hypothetical protein SFRURICE_020348 [Spodoptera frugiperda]